MTKLGVRKGGERAHGLHVCLSRVNLVPRVLERTARRDSGVDTMEVFEDVARGIRGLGD